MLRSHINYSELCTKKRRKTFTKSNPHDDPNPLPIIPYNMDSLCRVCMAPGSYRLFRVDAVNNITNNAGNNQTYPSNSRRIDANNVSSFDKLLEKLRYVTMLQVLYEMYILYIEPKYCAQHFDHDFAYLFMTCNVYVPFRVCVLFIQRMLPRRSTTERAKRKCYAIYASYS